MPTRLSIIIPVFNCSDTIARTLQSLTCVDVKNRDQIEIICSDDGSTDESMSTADDIKQDLPEFDWQVLRHHTNTGVSNARNRALEKANGDWVLFLDSDDELLADPTEFISSTDAQTSSLIFSVVRRNLNSNKESQVKPPRLNTNLYDLFTSQSPVAICAVIFRRSAMTAHFDPETYLLEDWKFWIENIQIFESPKIIGGRSPLARVNIHDHNRTSQYSKSGKARSQIACHLLATSTAWTKRQSENLKMQKLIGEIQQQQNVNFLDLLMNRCATSLKVKAVLYWLLGRRVSIFSAYKQSDDSQNSTGS